MIESGARRGAPLSFSSRGFRTTHAGDDGEPASRTSSVCRQALRPTEV
jgi:hypothetical protein